MLTEMLKEKLSGLRSWAGTDFGALTEALGHDPVLLGQAYRARYLAYDAGELLARHRGEVDVGAIVVYGEIRELAERMGLPLSEGGERVWKRSLIGKM